MKLLTVVEVATVLNVSKSLVYALIENGQLVPHRIGNGRGCVRIAESDLKAYVHSCRQEKRHKASRSRKSPFV